MICFSVSFYFIEAIVFGAGLPLANLAGPPALCPAERNEKRGLTTLKNKLRLWYKS
jgi:hypothetical protein